MNPIPGWAKTFAIPAILAVLVIPAAAWGAAAAHRLVLGWCAVALLIVVFTALTGRAVVGHWRGVLIDSRNVISLSRFQMVLWTALVLSAFVTAALFNVYAGVGEPLAIQIPNEMWALMGISTASLVGSPLMLSQKATKTPSQQAFGETKTLLAGRGFPTQGIESTGQVIRNTTPSLAQWSDMFTGDETSNGAHLDLAKLQMFFFTLLLAIGYGAALWHMFKYAQADGLSAFPALDESSIALIGISHVGYLANKVVPRS